MTGSCLLQAFQAQTPTLDDGTQEVTNVARNAIAACRNIATLAQVAAMYITDAGMLAPIIAMSSKAPLQQLVPVFACGEGFMNGVVYTDDGAEADMDVKKVVPLLATVTKKGSRNIWAPYGPLAWCAEAVPESAPDSNDWGWAQRLRDELNLPADLPDSLHSITQDSACNTDGTRRYDKHGKQLDDSQQTCGHMRRIFQRLVAATGDQELMNACLPPGSNAEDFLQGEPPFANEFNPIWNSEAGPAGFLMLVLTNVWHYVKEGLPAWQKHVFGPMGSGGDGQGAAAAASEGGVAAGGAGGAGHVSSSDGSGSSGGGGGSSSGGSNGSGGVAANPAAASAPAAAAVAAASVAPAAPLSAAVAAEAGGDESDDAASDAADDDEDAPSGHPLLRSMATWIGATGMLLSAVNNLVESVFGVARACKGKNPNLFIENAGQQKFAKHNGISEFLQTEPDDAVLSVFETAREVRLSKLFAPLVSRLQLW